MINIGYDAGDGGSYSIPFVENQQVSKVGNLSLVSDSLEIWCSSYSQIDSMNFDQFLLLDSIECFLSQSTSHISLNNLPNLSRLCLEDNNLSTLDLSGCPALADIRGASNAYTNIRFSESTEEVWHICIRDNPQLTNDTLFAHMERFPNISDLFIWNDNQKGPFRLTPLNTQDRMLLLAASNHYTSLNLEGSLIHENGYAMVEFSGNKLNSVNLKGCDQIVDLYLNNNGMSTDTIDKILYQLDQLGTHNRRVELRGNYPPSETGSTYKANLQAKGWTVLTEANSEIEITGNNLPISNGDNTPSETDFTHFGSVNVGEGGITRQFVIANSGSDTLVFRGDEPYAFFQGDESNNFTVHKALKPSLPPSGSDTLSIHFDATLNGIFDALVTIGSNDWNENPYRFTIRAESTIANPDTIIDFSTIID